MAVAADPLADLRTYIERSVADVHIPADDRALTLQRLRDDLEVTLGAVDTYLGRLRLRQQAESMVSAADIAKVRENATLREEILRRGLGTPEQLDEAGFIDADEIERLEEEGLLEATVSEIRTKWDEVLRPVEEAGFTPRLHPRDRKGRFLDTPNLVPLMDEREDLIRELTDAGIDVNALLGPPPPSDAPPNPDYPKIMRPDKFSAEVQKINTADDATAYLKGLGFEDSDMTGDPVDGVGPFEADWYRQIAQAVTDASANFTSLKEGPYPLRGVRIGRRTDTTWKDMDESQRENAWAVTSPDPVHTNGFPTRANATLNPGTWLSIIPNDSDNMASEYDTSGFSTASASSIYGRTMHELGHAVDESSGFTYANNGGGEADRFNQGDFGVDSVARLSQYGASSAAEAWAEVFSSLHTPHGLDPYPKDLQDKVREFQHYVNERFGNGKLL